MACLFCGIETSNPRSCFAKYTNKRRNYKTYKNARTYFCTVCKIQVAARQKYCLEHTPQNRKHINTIGDYTKYTYQRNSRIRQLARQVVKHLPRKCQVCGYEKHVEIAHKQAISSYATDTPISVVNAPENLLLLCPNCHWEFDHQQLTIATPSK
jgi:predicted restriction endonuclease